MELSDLEHDDSFRGRISTVDKEGNRNWIYVLAQKGKFYNWRTFFTAIYLIVFFGLPFIYVDGMPFVQFNIPQGRFILFSKIFWPQDFFIFAVGMVTFIVFIALFTVIYGRLFCGWACPQTVFMEFVFRKIEWWIEGSPNQQRQLNAMPWEGKKIGKKVLKHSLFLLFSFLIAHTFLSYIVSIEGVWKIINEPIGEHPGLFFGLLIFTLFFYATFAFVRDLVCTTICPYGRLQSVLFDKDTMLIAYDYERGEPREKIKKNESRQAGDCVECKKCIQVCPTGIDIRNGVQMECVGCTACIDACDEVMEKVGFKKGLIRYASENEIALRKPFHFNTRMKAYTLLLIGLVIFNSVLIFSRKPYDIYISRAQGQLYQELENGSISNLYEAKIINKTKKDIDLQLKLINSEGKIKLIGDQQIRLKKEALNEFTFFVELPKTEADKRKNKIILALVDGGKIIQKVKTNFLGAFKS